MVDFNRLTECELEDMGYKPDIPVERNDDCCDKDSRMSRTNDGLKKIEVDEMVNPAITTDSVVCGLFNRIGKPRLTGRTAKRGLEKLTEVEFSVTSGFLFWKKTESVKLFLRDDEFRFIHPIIIDELEAV